jgi:DNA polymerase/3'-5' exonuclease PolX
MSYNTSTVNMNATSIAAFIVNLQKENTDLRNKIKTLEDQNTELHIQLAEYYIETETSSDTESVASNDYESDSDTESESDFFVSYNSDLTDAFDKLASYEEDPHKRDAYRKAADAIYKLPFEVKSGSELASGPMKVPGIGKGIAKKIDEFLETGKIKRLQDLKKMEAVFEKTASICPLKKLEKSWSVVDETHNDALVDHFLDMATEESDEFKAAAYEKAAEAIDALNFKVTSGEELSKGPKKVPGIGKGIAKKIDEFLETGKIKRLEELKKTTSTNEEIAWALEALASLEAEPHGSQDPFKIRAYRRAAEIIRELSFEVTSGEEIAKGPKKIEGIGAGIGKKIDEFLQTGKMQRIEELTK